MLTGGSFMLIQGSDFVCSLFKTDGVLGIFGQHDNFTRINDLSDLGYYFLKFQIMK